MKDNVSVCPLREMMKQVWESAEEAVRCEEAVYLE